MAEVIGAKVEIDASSVGNVRKQLKEATADLIAMQQQFGETSKEAIQAAKRVAGLKDQIQAARETADLFDPGNKFKAFGNAIGAIANGFTAVQGAMGLFGVESKEVEKQLLRVQSAMALSQGLSGLADVGKNFNGITAMIKTKVIPAFSTLRGAIISTGFGALAVALGLIIANFEAVKTAIFSIFPGLEKLTKFIGGLVTKMTDFVGVTSAAGRQLDALEKKTKSGSEEIQNRIKVLQAQGGKEKEIHELSKQLADDELNFLKEKEKTKGKLSEEDLKRRKDLETQKQVLDFSEQRRIDDLNKQRRDKNNAEHKKNLEDLKKQNEEKLKLQEAADKVLDDARRARLTPRQKAEEDAIKKFEESKAKLRAAGIRSYLPIERQLQDELAAIKAKYDKDEKDALEKQTQERLKQFDVFVKGADAVAQKLAALVQKNNDNAKYEVETRIALQNQLVATYAEGIGALGTLFDQGTAASKASALAEIAVNAGLGFANGLRIAQQTAAGTGPAAAFAFPIFYAQQVAAVIKAVGSARNILKQVKGGGNGGAISAPSVSRAAPNTPGLSAQTQLQLQNQQAINNMGNQSMRAYVLNSDIRNNNQRNAYLQRNSRIG
jgi:hypothetical protein